MSPRAACRLEQFGFAEVYDFVHGKSFWLGSGLPTEGPDASSPRVGAAADLEVPVCTLGATVATARQRIADADGWDQCIVTDDDGIVAGRLRASALDAPDETLVDDVMEPGPTTVRPDFDLDELRDRMQDRNVASTLVTEPSGRLVGVYRRSS